MEVFNLFPKNPCAHVAVCAYLLALKADPSGIVLFEGCVYGAV